MLRTYVVSKMAAAINVYDLHINYAMILIGNALLFVSSVIILQARESLSNMRITPNRLLPPFSNMIFTSFLEEKNGFD